jgi:hypothetical protein
LVNAGVTPLLNLLTRWRLDSASTRMLASVTLALL